MQEANVVTSENSTEFYAAKLNLPATPPAEAEKSEPVVENQSEDDSSEQNEDKATEAEEPHKPNPKLEKRFSELTKQREDARREAAKEREARELAENRARELEAKLNPPKVETDAKPQPGQFSDAFEYAEALAEWSAENALKHRDQKEAEKKQQEVREKVIKTWNERQAVIESEFPDYKDVISSSEVVVSDPVRDAIVESDVGPKILYHLAQNPKIAESLATKSIASQLREIGKLEANLSASPTESKPKANDPARKISGAPAPISPIKGANSISESLMDSNGNFHGTYQQWKAARAAGKIK